MRRYIATTVIAFGILFVGCESRNTKLNAQPVRSSAPQSSAPTNTPAVAAPLKKQPETPPAVKLDMTATPVKETAPTENKTSRRRDRDAIPPLEPSIKGLRKEIKALFSLKGSSSTSIGSSDNGRLEGGVRLPDSGLGFLHNHSAEGDASYGTVETVQALVRAAAVFIRRCPGENAVINDLSGPQGGSVAHHWSHQVGRDVDILFFYRDTRNKPIKPLGVPIDPQGEGWDFKDLARGDDDLKVRMDLQRSWCFIQALIESAGPLIQRLFVAEHLRTMLLQQAEKSGAPSEIRERFGEITCQPSTPHDDHLHVRFFCTAEDVRGGCQDMYPIYPWREQALRSQGVEPVLARTNAEQYAKANQRVVSAAQARLRAGRMHWRVKKFLDQRNAWLPKPHPGRPWCQ